MIDYDKVFMIAPSWTSLNERKLLSELAKDVPADGTIVEIGCLYGGVTSILGLSAPNAQVITIDNFSWTPEGYPAASPQLAMENFNILGVFNIYVMNMTSRDAAKRLDTPIDLLWIDGGHDFKSVYFDLFHFSKYSRGPIALHDYDNPGWKDIRQAVEVFLKKNDDWYIDKVVDMVVVLRKKD